MSGHATLEGVDWTEREHVVEYENVENRKLPILVFMLILYGRVVA